MDQGACASSNAQQINQSRAIISTAGASCHPAPLGTVLLGDPPSNHCTSGAW